MPWGPGASDPQLALAPKEGLYSLFGEWPLSLPGECCPHPWRPSEHRGRACEDVWKGLKWSSEGNGNWNGVQTPLQPTDKRQVVFVNGERELARAVFLSASLAHVVSGVDFSQSSASTSRASALRVLHCIKTNASLSTCLLTSGARLGGQAGGQSSNGKKDGTALPYDLMALA